MPISIALLGANGKMGKTLNRLISEDPRFEIAELLDQSALVIDFSHPSVMEEHLKAALDAKKPLVIGTTGHPPEFETAIHHASQKIPILFSPNFSLGMALCLQAVALFGKHLFGKSYIDIIETHHVHKKDAPSGTALKLAHAIGHGTLASPEAPRKPEGIVIHSIRSGEVIGEHTVRFECQGETLELTHKAHSREAFAKGALEAAAFLIGKPPGLYSLKEILNKTP